MENLLRPLSPPPTPAQRVARKQSKTIELVLKPTLEWAKAEGWAASLNKNIKDVTGILHLEREDTSNVYPQEVHTTCPPTVLVGGRITHQFRSLYGARAVPPKTAARQTLHVVDERNAALFWHVRGQKRSIIVRYSDIERERILLS
ncbi:hypothetical protein M427DRAFT_421326 [Gonapodya prolifera JEL478]|uniref:Uncharacterized protein n=1 Tax=Gonapodya prolifera (strain JEL478) TaxID=1344416 RepID=A0A139A4I9_GONPJ|nr:hypothetical protein M427DRAFT_421326 [Gonapodya prolifera JEL478]|eukprot:KXS11711.1 hypothetical protein M427DRAFT_421326 [Gonapodya prolifera JEL478]